VERVRALGSAGLERDALGATIRSRRALRVARTRGEDLRTDGELAGTVSLRVSLQRTERAIYEQGDLAAENEGTTQVRVRCWCRQDAGVGARRPVMERSR
jgi:hypothetical protein